MSGPTLVWLMPQDEFVLLVWPNSLFSSPMKEHINRNSIPKDLTTQFGMTFEMNIPQGPSHWRFMMQAPKCWPRSYSSLKYTGDGRVYHELHSVIAFIEKPCTVICSLNSDINLFVGNVSCMFCACHAIKEWYGSQNTKVSLRNGRSQNIHHTI